MHTILLGYSVAETLVTVTCNQLSNTPYIFLGIVISWF